MNPYIGMQLGALIGSLLGKASDDAIILKNAKEEMDERGKYLVRKYGPGSTDGLDNYYHRKGMYHVLKPSFK